MSINKEPSLLSHTPPSPMAARHRETANIPTLVTHNPYHEPNNPHTDKTPVEVSAPGGENTQNNYASKLARPQSSCSQSSATSSIDYATRMETQSGTWAEQMDIVDEGLNASLHTPPEDPTAYTFSLQTPSTYITPTYTHLEPTRDAQLANRANNTPTTYLEENNNPSVVLETTVIPYNPNAPADPQLWDGGFAATLLFGTEEFLEGNIKNITYSLQCITTFIRQRDIKGRSINDLSQLQEVSFAAWEFVLAIYEAG